LCGGWWFIKVVVWWGEQARFIFLAWFGLCGDLRGEKNNI
jgi:hypothetical protein